MNFGEFWRRLRTLFHSRRFQSELDEEMRFHREMKEKEFRDRGEDSEQARFAANRAFGNATALRERSGEAWGWLWLEDLRRDVIYAARDLRRNPGFALTAVITLLLGIGATTAIFSVVNTVLLQPLDYQDPRSLVRLQEKHEGFDDVAFTYATYIDVAEAHWHSLAAVAGYRPWSFNLTGDGDPEQVDGSMVSANLFAVLGTAPQLGRSFTPAEQKEGADRVVILSYALWKGRFASDPGIIGKAIRVNDVPHEVVGVMPASFEFPDKTVWLAGTGVSQVWTPLVIDSYLAANRKSHLVKAIGRLAPGSSLEGAESELQAFAKRLNEQYPGVDPEMGMGAWNLQQHMTARVRPALLVLLGAVTLMVFAACSNVANLVLMRNTARAREFAVRAALGAGQARLLRQSLVESVLLGVIGGGGGVLVAFWSIRGIAVLGPEDIPRLSPVRFRPFAPDRDCFRRLARRSRILQRPQRIAEGNLERNHRCSSQSAAGGAGRRRSGGGTDSARGRRSAG
jgi:predicted permease